MIAGMPARAVVIYEIAHARAALQAATAAGAAVELWSAPNAAAYAGAGWLAAVVRQAAAAAPQARYVAVLDCADRADLAQAALRQGLSQICYRGPPGTAGRLADIARQYGATLHRRRPRALDLMHAVDPLAACGAWLGGN